MAENRIVDHLGRPIRTSELGKEIATPQITGVRPTLYDSIASFLTPTRLGTIIQEVDQGDGDNYLTLAEEMEERDLHYHSVLSTRKLAISGLESMVEAYSDEPKDVEIADFVRSVVQANEFTQLITDMTDALGKSYSVSEIVWDTSEKLWQPAEYKHRDPRHFVFDQETQRELRLRHVDDMVNGVPLEPAKFCVHYPNIKTGLPLRGGLARLAVVAYMCKSYTLKDWMAFNEVFGMPLRIGKFDDAATAEQKASLLAAVSQIGTDAACIIPEDMIIEFAESSKTTGGEKLYLNAVTYFDSQTSKGVLGQTATTDGTPGKLGADDTQDKVRSDIRLNDARQMSITIQKYVIKPLVDLNFPGPRGRHEYPKFKLGSKEQEDLKLLSESLPPFIELGLPVEASVILDKFNLPSPGEGAEVLKPRAQPAPVAPTAPPTEEPPEEPEGEEEQNAKQERRRALAFLMNQVREGKELTPDQRLFLVATMAEEKKSAPNDSVDDITDEELDDWRRIMDPVLLPIIEHAKSSKGYPEFLKGLEEVMAKIDSSEFRDRIAVSTFKTRGMGDATDDV